MVKKYLLLFLCFIVFTLDAATVGKHEQQTLSMIKPDAVEANRIGDIISRFEKAGLKIIAMKMAKLSQQDAERFYAEHKGKPFYPGLIEFMSSGSVVAMVLQGPDAIEKNRRIMGATDPAKALPRTIRRDFARSIQTNAIHGSDSPKSAEREIRFFFLSQEIFSR